VTCPRNTTCFAGGQLAVFQGASELPDSFSFFGGGTLFGISVPIIVTVIGTFFGVLTIGVLRNGLNLLKVSPFWVQFVQGAVISSPSF
jgi:ribose/xylose/arabinose/galactoside ABC-type transport system permease subunit